MPNSTSKTQGIEVCQFNRSIGVKLDPWQRLVVTDSLAEEDPGTWAAFEVGVVVPRQNGKGEILMARELGGLFVLGEKLILHSAHEFKTAREHFLRILDVVTNYDALRKRIKRPHMSHGEEGIELLNGNRLRFVARSRGSGRGFTGDCIVLDEAYDLSAEGMAALLPTLSARPNPQLWYASSAGLEHSIVLQRLRERAIALLATGATDQVYDTETEQLYEAGLAYFEWSSPDDANHADPEMWALANPAMGIRISEKFISREQQALDPVVFGRERLGIWFDSSKHNVIDMRLWAEISDRDSQLAEDSPLVLAIDTTPERSVTAMAIHGLRSDGAGHSEVIEERPGTDWVVSRAVSLAERWNFRAVGIDPNSPAGAFLAPLRDAGVPVETVSGQDMGQACGAFIDGVTNGTFRHRDQKSLAVALGCAMTKPTGDGAFTWSRKTTTGNIAPLVAVTMAQFLFEKFGRVAEDDFYIAADFV